MRDDIGNLIGMRHTPNLLKNPVKGLTTHDDGINIGDKLGVAIIFAFFLYRIQETQVIAWTGNEAVKAAGNIKDELSAHGGYLKQSEK